MQLSAIYDWLRTQGFDLWVISPQDVGTNHALGERRGLPFPVLADPDQRVIHEWGLFNSDDPKGRQIPHPAAFIVGYDGLVHWSYVGASTRDRLEIEQVKSAIEASKGVSFQ